MLKSIGTSVAVLVAFAGMESTGANALAIRSTEGGITGAAEGEYLKPQAGGLAQTETEQTGEFKSTAWDQPIQITFTNESDQDVELLWHNYQGIEVSYGTIVAGGTMLMHTYVTHPWSVVGFANSDAPLTVDGQDVFVPEKSDGGRTVVIGETYKSERWDQMLKLVFANESDQQIELFWHNYEGVSVSYGHIGAFEQREQYTFATHPWSAKAIDGTEEEVDGVSVFVPTASDDGRTIIIGDAYGDYKCDTSVNFMQPGPAYSQISLTDGCNNGVCDANPKYGAPNNNEKAKAFCEDHCNDMTTCEGFFFQKHMNGHEICGFYAGGMSEGTRVWHGHQAGAICKAI